MSSRHLSRGIGYANWHTAMEQHRQGGTASPGWNSIARSHVGTASPGAPLEQHRQGAHDTGIAKPLGTPFWNSIARDSKAIGHTALEQHRQARRWNNIASGGAALKGRRRTGTEVLFGSVIDPPRSSCFSRSFEVFAAASLPWRAHKKL